MGLTEREDKIRFNRSAVLELLEGAKLNRLCEVCHRPDAWLIPTLAEDPNVVDAMMTVKWNDTSSGFVFIPMICKHCGNTRFLHHETLIEIAGSKGEIAE